MAHSVVFDRHLAAGEMWGRVLRCDQIGVSLDGGKRQPTHREVFGKVARRANVRSLWRGLWHAWVYLASARLEARNEHVTGQRAAFQKTQIADQLDEINGAASISRPVPIQRYARECVRCTGNPPTEQPGAVLAGAAGSEVQ